MSDTTRVWISLYKRRVAAGEFPESMDTVKAFAAGLTTSGEAKQALRKLQAGTENSGIALMLVLYGVAFAGTVIAMLITGDGIVHSGDVYLFSICVLFLIGAYAARRRGITQARRAREQFDIEWADGQFEKKEATVEQTV